jgi:uncharacterized protein (TIGR00290 family)
VPPPNAYVSWSSGKDSAFALYEAQKLGHARIAGILTTINQVHERVAMHGVRNALLDKQVAALGLPCLRVPLPSPCPNDIYEQRMAQASAEIKGQGIDHIVFGDLFLEEIRHYREVGLAAAGMHGIFPLWKRDTAVLARDMIASGLEAYIVCLDPLRLSRDFAGRRFDDAFLRDLPATVDPCGENGEFHTVVTAGPMFKSPIAVAIGETVERDGFVFSDVVPN